MKSDNFIPILMKLYLTVSMLCLVLNSQHATKGKKSGHTRTSLSQAAFSKLVTAGMKH